MKAKIRDVGFSPDRIVVGVDCYFEEGVDVPDYPATEEEPNPPTHPELRPFRSISISLPVDTSKDDAVKAVKDKLQAFKRAHDKVVNAQQFVDLEFTV